MGRMRGRRSLGICCDVVVVVVVVVWVWGDEHFLSCSNTRDMSVNIEPPLIRNSQRPNLELQAAQKREIIRQRNRLTLSSFTCRCRDILQVQIHGGDATARAAARALLYLGFCPQLAAFHSSFPLIQPHFHHLAQYPLTCQLYPSFFIIIPGLSFWRTNRLCI